MTSPTQELESSLIEWRRARIIEYLAIGKKQSEIATILKVDPATVSRDVKYLRKHAKVKHGQYIENLPFEHQKSLVSIDKAHAELWALFEQASDVKQRKGILDSIGEIVIKRQILLGDPEHIDRALKAVARIRKQLAEQQQEKEEHEQEVEAE